MLPGEKGKFLPNWFGSFFVIEDFGSGAYKLADMDGVSFKEPINIMHLKCYYPSFYSFFFLHLYIPYRHCFIGYAILEKLHIDYIYALSFFLLSFILNIDLNKT